jgi:Peptidase family M23
VPARSALVPVLLTLAALAGAQPAMGAAGGWVRPVHGVVTRGFALGADPFARGSHRGADFAAAPGAGVRAPCAGRVVVAGRIGSSGGVVTIACGRWRVSALPLSRIGVVVGQLVRAGAPLGAAGASSRHAGVHLGVRRAGRAFGYVDPLRFLGRGHRVPPAGPVAPGRTAPRAPVAGPRAVSPPRRASFVTVPASRPGVASLPLAPWPAWAGLAALLIAAAGRAGLRLRPGPRRRPAAVSHAGLGKVR